MNGAALALVHCYLVCPIGIMGRGKVGTDDDTPRGEGVVTEREGGPGKGA